MKASKVKRIGVAALAAGMSLMVIGASACNDKPAGAVGSFNNDKDPIVFSTLEVDKVFSPFYATTGPDMSVVGMTQISMLGNDENGNVAYGKDEPVVTLDYEMEKEGSVEDVDLFSTYKFVMKNDVKFSNGSPLTIKDVLFNYYVYLDPVYTGSTTIYSTDIVGLAEYRTQKGDKSEQDHFMDQYNTAADTRIDELDYAANDILKKNPGVDEQQFLDLLIAYAGGKDTNLVKDYNKALELFRAELETDYSNSLNSFQDTVFTGKDGTILRNLLKSDMEQFLYNEGYIEWKKNQGANGELVCKVTSSLEELRTKKKADGSLYWDKAAVINYVYGANIPDNISDVITYWMTASDLHTFIANEELEKDSANSELAYPNISGIKFANRTESITVNGKTYEPVQYNDDGSVKEGYNEVLTIKIKNIDPKAIWNFGITVSPMYYYSDAEHIEKFNFTDSFGVERASQSWYDKVIKAKNDIPVGAGPYAASNGTTEGVNVAAGQLPSASSFYDNGTIYFKRNPYYIGGAPKIQFVRFQVAASAQMTNNLYSGAMDFVEPSSTPEIESELNKHKKTDNVDYKTVPTLGYGYIGVNAGKVPSIYVRRAIMHSISTKRCVDYYKGGADAIYRPMSKQSWAYPENSVAYYPYLGDPVPANLDKVYPDYADYVRSLGKKSGDKLTENEQKEYIRILVEDYGKYKLNGNGVYAKGSDVLKYTFTIVGEEQNHPAWNALFLAGQFLNGCGFEINTTTDSQGLRKLNSGSLTVWAAAWGSTIDPDMYQVYHKESTATSTLNWGYKQILLNAGGKYNEEKALVDDLSDLIDAARRVDDSTKAGKNERARIYSSALDIVMEMAVELPTYQRSDLFAYNTYRIDVKSFFKNPTAYKGLTSNMHLLSLNVAQ